MYFSCRSSLANWYNFFFFSVVKFVSARSIFWCNVDVEWRWQGSWASNGAMAPSLPANPNFYLLALFCPLFGSLGCEDCWRCKRGCQRKGHSNIVMLADTWEPKMPNWLSVTIICVVWNKPWGKSYIVHKKCNKQSLHHPQSLEDALGFQEELLTELTKRAQMSEKTADRALAEQFARSKPNFCTLLLSSASPRSLARAKNAGQHKDWLSSVLHSVKSSLNGRLLHIVGR